MILRPMRAADESSFVFSNWLRSYATSDVALLYTPRDDEHTRECPQCGHRRMRMSRTADRITKPMVGREYWDAQGALVTSLLLTSNVTVAESPDGLLDGFIARHPTAAVVHYVYVRQSARNRGVAKALIADLAERPVRYTHRSRALEAARLPKGWRFDPYALVTS